MKLVDHKEPFALFNEWIKKARENPNIIDPNAMILATVGNNSKPTSRMMLLKKFDENGFCFFTNMTSRKGKDLKANPHVCLCFYWPEFGYQVRVEGIAGKVTAKEADEYFSTRRRGSQIGTWASKQSEELESKEELEGRIREIEKNFEGQNVPRPPFWSGYRVIPNLIEFWEEGEFRLHTRTLYSKKPHKDGWAVSKLYP